MWSPKIFRLLGNQGQGPLTYISKPGKIVTSKGWQKLVSYESGSWTRATMHYGRSSINLITESKTRLIWIVSPFLPDSELITSLGKVDGLIFICDPIRDLVADCRWNVRIEFSKVRKSWLLGFPTRVGPLPLPFFLDGILLQQGRWRMDVVRRKEQERERPL